jgi:hypothetical protein
MNETGWPASVCWRAQGKEYNTVLNAYSCEVLGALSDITSLEIGTYGQVWGSLFPKHVLSLEHIKRENRADQDVRIIIETARPHGWSFKTVLCEKPDKRIRFLPSDPWDAFPGALRASRMGRPVMPHHVLNVDPGRMSKQVAINCYKRLLALWNPEKFPGDSGGTAKKICAILRQAHLDLQRELIEDERHTEHTVYEHPSDL